MKTPAAKLVDARQRAILCAQVASDNRGRDIVVLDMTGLVQWVDYLVIATGASRRQIITVADEIEQTLEDLGDRRIGLEGHDRGSWLVLDFADILIHIFSEEKREYYQLEHLWDDAPRIDWEREPAATVSDERLALR